MSNYYLQTVIVIMTLNVFKHIDILNLTIESLNLQKKILRVAKNISIKDTYNVSTIKS